jgi:hypothetical protein
MTPMLGICAARQEPVWVDVLENLVGMNFWNELWLFAGYGGADSFPSIARFGIVVGVCLICRDSLRDMKLYCRWNGRIYVQYC